MEPRLQLSHQIYSLFLVLYLFSSGPSDNVECVESNSHIPKLSGKPLNTGLCLSEKPPPSSSSPNAMPAVPCKSGVLNGGGAGRLRAGRGRGGGSNGTQSSASSSLGRHPRAQSCHKTGTSGRLPGRGHFEVGCVPPKT